jgi:ABC-2 type transport system permease protein
MIVNTILQVAKRELKRMLSRKIYIVITLIIPLFSFFLFTSLFNEGVARKLPVVLVDQDHSSLSHKVARNIEATPSVKIVKQVETLDQAKLEIESWNCYAVVFIPNDFEKNTYRGDAPGVVLYYNNINLAAGSSISKDIRMAVGTLSAQVKVAGKMQAGEMQQQAIESSNPVVLDTHVLYNPYVSYEYFITTSMLPIMLQMFVLLMSIYAIGVELKEHTAGRWLKVANGKAWIAITGKLLPYTIIFWALAIFMNMLMFRFLNTPIKGGVFLLFVSTLLYVLAYQAVGILFISLRANLRESLSFGMAYASLAFSFCGLAFPILAMPLIARIFAYFFPFTHYLRLFVDQGIKGMPLYYSASSLAALILFIAIPSLAIFRLKKAMINEEMWGKH